MRQAQAPMGLGMLWGGVAIICHGCLATAHIHM